MRTDITIITTIRAMEHHQTQHWLDQSKISPLFGRAKKQNEHQIKKICLLFEGQHLWADI